MDQPLRLEDGPAGGAPGVLLAHGAGGGMDVPLLEAVAEGLAADGCRVRRFEFPYMQRARAAGRRRPPDREAALLQTWREEVARFRREGAAPLVIGGKSLGGRMATLVAEELEADGVLCLGYPFHPPRRPQRQRTAHLATLRVPTLILQGERDPFGGRQEVAGYRLAPAIRIAWLTDGDHEFRPRRRSGLTEADNQAVAVRQVLAFCRHVARTGPRNAQSARPGEGD